MTVSPSQTGPCQSCKSEVCQQSLQRFDRESLYNFRLGQVSGQPQVQRLQCGNRMWQSRDSHPQTQPSFRPTSSGKAEARALSRGVREIMFIKQLGGEDFGLRMVVPRVWTDASTGLQTSKRLGAGSRMRHIDVAMLHVQELVYQKQLKVGKAFGTAIPSNCFTKHLDANLKNDCLQDLGMVDINVTNSSDRRPLIEAAEQIELVAAVVTTPAIENEHPVETKFHNRR